MAHPEASRIKNAAEYLDSVGVNHPRTMFRRDEVYKLMEDYASIRTQQENDQRAEELKTLGIRTITMGH